ncbi:MAG: phosphoglycerate mutase [Micavibrio sp.]|nr:phosphoglycerate mutase [Micavibrio sp.]|tara:strand:- start:352 stop:975 length:624 start_codon:yes stop_codon:yes gene_type:complete
MTTLIIARHGNTFGPGDTPTRVGKNTDLPLVEKGEEQARALGRYLATHRMIPDVVYSSNLQRTLQTAKIAIKASKITNPVFQLDIFDEVDYGPDENKPEDEVIARIGKQAIQDWDERAIVPQGWKINPDEVIQNWRLFAEQICAHNDNETVLVVTSNGIARFAPYITGNFEQFRAKHALKLSTGSVGILKHDFDSGWRVDSWNVKPE